MIDVARMPFATARAWMKIAAAKAGQMPPADFIDAIEEAWRLIVGTPIDESVSVQDLVAEIIVIAEARYGEQAAER